MKKIIFTLLIFLLFRLTNAQDLNNSQLQASSPNLQALNLINVTIGGAFVVNGTFPALRTERVDQFVTRVFTKYQSQLTNATDNKKLSDIFISELNSYAKRDILLKRFDGTQLKIDLEKFRLTGDFSYNPYLKNDDVLIFPVVDLERNFIDISGAVNLPVKFQFVDGDKLSDAILFANGLNHAYRNITTAEITRLSYDGKSKEIYNVKLNDDFSLKVGDRIRILADETQRKNYQVFLIGEVFKPGYIYISKGNTTIEEVIKKAGGFRPDADLNNAEVIRNSSQLKSGDYIVDKIFDQKSDLLLMQRMSDLALGDSLTFLTDNAIRFTRSNATVDFTKVLDINSKSSKFIVRDKDIIYIPQKRNQVYIYGQVMDPGYIEYKNGADYSYYLKRVGGLGKTAKNDVYLIKSKSRAWINMTDTEDYNIDPGDFIWVPKDVPKDFNYYLARTASIAGVIGAVATLVLIFKR